MTTKTQAKSRILDAKHAAIRQAHAALRPATLERLFADEAAL